MSDEPRSGEPLLEYHRASLEAFADAFRRCNHTTGMPPETPGSAAHLFSYIPEDVVLRLLELRSRVRRWS